MQETSAERHTCTFKWGRLPQKTSFQLHTLPVISGRDVLFLRVINRISEIFKLDQQYSKLKSAWLVSWKYLCQFIQGWSKKWHQMKPNNFFVICFFSFAIHTHYSSTCVVSVSKCFFFLANERQKNYGRKTKWRICSFLYFFGNRNDTL